MELKAQNKLKLLNTGLGSAGEFIIKQREDNQSQLSQNDINQLLTPQDLEMKTSAILSKTSNTPDIEQDFRRTYAIFESQKSASSSELNEAYQKYIRAYYKMTSLYMIHTDFSKNTFLLIFDTEKEAAKIIKLEISELITNSICLAVLPNGDLFCFGDWQHPGITFILNSDYEARMLPTGEPCSWSSAIYFNRNVYCFGGVKASVNINLSSKYDLDRNRWAKLTPMPMDDSWCSNVIFKGSILISGCASKNLFLYSIDTNSFSTIPYDFAVYKKKILINTERLYLIECAENGLIYESEAEDEYTWKQIAISTIKTPYPAYSLYNKGGIYIITGQNKGQFYKFDLNKKEIYKI